MSRFRIVLALGIATSVAFGDADPPAPPGYRFLRGAIEVDQTALPKDRVLVFVKPLKRGFPIDDSAKVMQFGSSQEGEDRIDLYVAPRAEADRLVFEDLKQRGASAVQLYFPRGELPLTDPRTRIKRRYRVVSADPLDIEAVEDVFENQAGEVVCRAPPNLDVGPGYDDPCRKKSRTELMSIFVRDNQIWLASGVVGTLLATGAAWMLVCRKKKPAS